MDHERDAIWLGKLGPNSKKTLKEMKGSIFMSKSHSLRHLQALSHTSYALLLPLLMGTSRLFDFIVCIIGIPLLYLVLLQIKKVLICN